MVKLVLCDGWLDIVKDIWVALSCEIAIMAGYLCENAEHIAHNLKIASLCLLGIRMSIVRGVDLAQCRLREMPIAWDADRARCRLCPKRKEVARRQPLKSTEG